MQLPGSCAGKGSKSIQIPVLNLAVKLLGALLSAIKEHTLLDGCPPCQEFEIKLFPISRSGRSCVCEHTTLTSDDRRPRSESRTLQALGERYSRSMLFSTARYTSSTQLYGRRIRVAHDRC